MTARRLILAVARRLHVAELETLRDLAQRQHAEIDRLRADLLQMTESAEAWRDDALRAMDAACADGSNAPGLTMAGELVVTPVQTA